MSDKCQLTFTGKRDVERYIHRCEVCSREYSSAYSNPKMLKAECEHRAKPCGPGTELKAIFKSIGFNAEKQCGCENLRLEMDKLGVGGCRREFDRLAAVLQGKYQVTSWTERIRAAGLATLSGLAFRLNVANPVPDLLREAIKRAEAKGCDPPAVAPR
jgi:hypothetical protein